jgi:hypothetical protein
LQFFSTFSLHISRSALRPNQHKCHWWNNSIQCLSLSFFYHTHSFTPHTHAIIILHCDTDRAKKSILPSTTSSFGFYIMQRGIINMFLLSSNKKNRKRQSFIPKGMLKLGVMCFVLYLPSMGCIVNFCSSESSEKMKQMKKFCLTLIPYPLHTIFIFISFFICVNIRSTL